MNKLNIVGRILVLLVILGIISSCNRGSETQSQTDTTMGFDTAAFLKKLPELIEYPLEFDSKSKMVSINDYFSESQAESFNQSDWKALIYDSTSQLYSLKSVLSGENFEASVDVSEDGKVGYQFVNIAKEKQKTVYLFDNPWLKKELSHVKNWVNGELLLEGNETFDFAMGGKNYQLKATDRQLVVDGRQGSYDYRLYLHQLQNNEISKTVQLSYIPWFDDGQVRILFIGDLDGDQKPDVILDNAYKYTESGISGILFLSSAADGNLVKPICKEVHGELRGEDMHSEGC